MLTAVENQLPEMKNRYNLTEDTLDSIKLLRSEFEGVLKDYDKLVIKKRIEKKDYEYL